MDFFGPMIEAHQERGVRYEGLATDCLLRLDELPGDDLARPDIAAGAVAFAMLAVADALTTSVNSNRLADVVAIAGDVQP